MKNTLYKYTGVFFLFLAFWGAIIPILPCTPFVLLGSSLLLKGDKELHDKVMSNPKVRKIISDWSEHKVVAWDIKLKALLVLSISMTFSIWVVPIHEVKLGLAVLFGLLVCTILLLPSKKKVQEI
ncbi:DUF454 family protein [Vibrio crassostreae]|uniref:DUF454 family protein n=1 Tax=Vibrio crassostreae TaxID=246167 RepID=UPI001B31129A|nr:DUF454 family protein [Vibrio crassostreae]